MPHCVIEHSSTIDSNTLVPLVFNASLESALFEQDGSDIKVRAVSFVYYQTGALQNFSKQDDFSH
ncbi:hypothetical protein CMT41_07230 [Colwellia sp. MT41]|uniref:hypothetical protein n=1 Tax=Colwellia sp. MT41 TaxID=58049 RepID=UPI0007179A21|nr:hypothetical protein [Colwellia sp. MT41]ALO34529.1 hypothetical protein CMT41_07230 [Colwellia sp. MT41]